MHLFKQVGLKVCVYLKTSKILTDNPHNSLSQQMANMNPLTTIHDENSRCHSAMYVTIHDGNSRRIYYSYTRIPGSWHALRLGSEEVIKLYIIAND